MAVIKKTTTMTDQMIMMTRTMRMRAARMTTAPGRTSTDANGPKTGKSLRDSVYISIFFAIFIIF